MAEIKPLPEAGLLRLSHILAPRGPIPVSRSTWYAWVASGKVSKPQKLGPRISAWRVEDIRALIEGGALDRPAPSASNSAGSQQRHRPFEPVSVRRPKD